MSEENYKYFNGIFPLMFKKKEADVGKSIISSQNIYLKNEIIDKDEAENVDVNVNSNIYDLPNKKKYPKNNKKNLKKRECCILGLEKINCFELFTDIWKAI